VQIIGATAKFVVYSGSERYPLPNNTEAIDLIEFLQLLNKNTDQDPA